MWNLSESPRSARTISVVLLITSVVVCFTYALFRDVLPPWWKSHGGGIPYVLFWIFLLYTVNPNKKNIFVICTIVVLTTTMLEFLQLWNPEPLASFRKTRFGAALLGTTFVWNDIPPYFIGGVFGFAILHTIFGFAPRKN